MRPPSDAASQRHAHVEAARQRFLIASATTARGDDRVAPSVSLVARRGKQALTQSLQSAHRRLPCTTLAQSNEYQEIEGVIAFGTTMTQPCVGCVDPDVARLDKWTFRSECLPTTRKP